MKSALSDLLFRAIYGEHLYRKASLPRRAVCDLLFRVFGHRICCHVPEWAAKVGQPWDSYDVAPWNLFNVLWAGATWVRQGMTP